MKNLKNFINEGKSTKVMIHLAGSAKTGANYLLFGQPFTLAEDKDGDWKDKNKIDEATELAESLGFKVNFNAEDWLENMEDDELNDVYFYLVYQPKELAGYAANSPWKPNTVEVVCDEQFDVFN